VAPLRGAAARSRERDDLGSSSGNHFLRATRQNLAISWVFGAEMYLNLNRTEKNRKKPVETGEIWLTKRSERMKVNCGTVLRTRMNIDDFALKNGMRFYEIFMQVR
jgi:hypothetical protein